MERGSNRRERLISRRVQGDLGEFSAMEWLARKGALVWAPLGHSPDVDLIAEIEDRLLRLQVKTSTQREQTSKGDRRWRVMIATNGGNQSWNGATKTFDPARVDFLFALVGDGRRWMIPTHAIEPQRQIALGGPKYSEFEIEPTLPIEQLIYTNGSAPIKSSSEPGGAPESGEPGRPVKSVATLEWVRVPPPPSSSRHSSREGSGRLAEEMDSSAKAAPLRFQRTQISIKHQITIPSIPFHDAGLEVGDRLHGRADGPGRVVFERVRLTAN